MVSMEEDDSVAVSLLSKEEQFLKSRQQRASVKKCVLADPNNDDIQSRRFFWSSFKQYCHEWKERLQKTVQPYLDSENISADSRDPSSRQHELYYELDKFQEELKVLRQICLHSKDTNRNPCVMSRILPPPPDDLPIADIRLLHRDFTNLQSLLESYRSDLLPNHDKRPPFVFRKYRRALQHQQQQLSAPHNDDIPVQKPLEAEAVAPKETVSLFPPESSLVNYKNAFIVVHEDGSVSSTSSSTLELSTTDELHTKKIKSEIIVVQNVRHCTIQCHGRYKAVHFVNVHDSSIQLENAVQGAVHVTQCHHTSFSILQTQQLRLHESHHIECHVLVTAGTILEDCHHVTFCAMTADASTADIKDFNWLRTDIPSPNVVVQPCRHNNESLSMACHVNRTSSTPSMVKDVITSVSITATDEKQLERPNDEDDDEEL